MSINVCEIVLYGLESKNTLKVHLQGNKVRQTFLRTLLIYSRANPSENKCCKSILSVSASRARPSGESVGCKPTVRCSDRLIIQLIPLQSQRKSDCRIETLENMRITNNNKIKNNKNNIP